MPLQSKKNIEFQKSHYQEAVKKREELLKSQGLESKAVLRDSTLRSLKGKIRQMDQRYLSISASEKRGEISKNRKNEEAEKNKGPAVDVDVKVPKKKKDKGPAVDVDAKAPKKKKEKEPAVDISEKDKE
jgi:hypothetical protein